MNCDTRPFAVSGVEPPLRASTAAFDSAQAERIYEADFGSRTLAASPVVGPLCAEGVATAGVERLARATLQAHLAARRGRVDALQHERRGFLVGALASAPAVVGVLG